MSYPDGGARQPWLVLVAQTAAPAPRRAGTRTGLDDRVFLAGVQAVAGHGLADVLEPDDAQTDAAAGLVDLHDPDVNHVAAVDDVLDPVDTSGRQVLDEQQAVHALGELD